MDETRDPVIWVFGYGSLIWKPNFEFDSTRIGYIEGYVRRFWQGSVSHRGTPNNPGRVANVEKQSNGRVWGMAFKLVGQEQIDAAMEHLTEREITSGGYRQFWTKFTCRTTSEDESPDTFRVFCYTATAENPLYAGPSYSEACVIAHAKGPCGHNVEYLLRLAKWLRDERLHDDYMIKLERSVLGILRVLGVSDATEMFACKDGHLCVHCASGMEKLEADDPVYGESGHGLEG